METSRPKLYLARLWALIWNSIGRVGPHRVGQLAASISYYALLSVFPAAIVLAAVAGMILNDPTARQDVIDFLFDELPLNETGGRSDVESLVKGVTNNAGTLGVIGGVALLISASALVGAIRNSIAVIFEGDVSRGALRGKGLDLLLILGTGLLFVVSFASTILSKVEPDVGEGALKVIESVLTATGALLPIVISILVFTVLYTVLPVTRPRIRDVWPAIVFATLGFELVKWGFSVYLENFSNYSAIYGSLGAVVAFMVFIYIAAIVLLFGAEMAALWPEVRDGDHDPGSGDDDGPSKSFLEEVRDFAKSLVSRNPTGEHEIRRR